MAAGDERLDEVYERLAATGPEFEGWLSNHAPMAADALIRMGQADRVGPFLDRYVSRLEDRPRPRWTIRDAEWREPLGDPSRLGDWIAFFERQLDERPWEEVLVQWWPRLLPGSVAAAAHGLIRLGHAVRAVTEAGTTARLGELAQALGYWAARWQPLPGAKAPRGILSLSACLAMLPAPEVSGGFRSRIATLGAEPRWPVAQAWLHAPSAPGEVPAALDDLVDATVARYLDTAAVPVMLVHASTAPRAARLVLPALPEGLWLVTYRWAWSVAAAITAVYARHSALGAWSPPAGGLDAGELADRIADHGDEHVIKFGEVALESARRGRGTALLAAARACELISPAS